MPDKYAEMQSTTCVLIHPEKYVKMRLYSVGVSNGPKGLSVERWTLHTLNERHTDDIAEMA